MKKFLSSTESSILKLVLVAMIVTSKAQPFPTYYDTTDSVAVNGSSATGHCSSGTFNDGTITCTDPTSSVLFDGHIPTLTGLDGDMWASQLLTLQGEPNSMVEIDLNFTDTPGYSGIQRLEIVMFNCAQWGIGAGDVFLSQTGTTQPSDTFMQTFDSSTASCDSLVRVCLPASSTGSEWRLSFALLPNTKWVHLAELTFNDSSNVCPPNIIFPTPPSPTDGDTITQEVLTTPTSCETCPSCTMTTILAAVLSGLGMAIITTVIFLIAVRKFRNSKFTPAGEVGRTYKQTTIGVVVNDPTHVRAEDLNASEGMPLSDHTHMKTEQPQEDYEEVIIGEGGMAISDHTYRKAETPQQEYKELIMGEGGVDTSDHTYMKAKKPEPELEEYYDDVRVVEVGVAVNDPTYMKAEETEEYYGNLKRGVAVSDAEELMYEEISARDEGSTFELHTRDTATDVEEDNVYY